MRRSFSQLLLFVFFLTANVALSQDGTLYWTDDPPTTSHTTEVGNNTSACLASGNPSYCNEALPNLQTNSANQAGCPNSSPCAQTTIIDAIPEHISTIKINRLMNKGKSWGGQIICEYQPWFDNTGSYNGHIDIGYDENTLATVNYQDTTMINRGCNINLVDFYGVDQSSHPFELQSTNNVYGDLWPRTNPQLKFAIMEDQGSFDAKSAPFCGNQNPALSETATMNCIETALEGDMKYIHDNYILPHPTVMWTDGTANVIPYFGACSTFSALYY